MSNQLRTMRAARLHGIRDLRLEDLPRPAPGPGEVLLEVASVGVCGSDVHYYLEGRIGSQVVTSTHHHGPRVLGLGRRVGSGHRGAGRRAVGRRRSGDLLRRVRTLPTWASQSLPKRSLLRHAADQRRFRRVHRHARRELLPLAARIRAWGGRDARTAGRRHPLR